MKNFVFHADTKMIFGKDTIQMLPEAVKPFGKNVLLVYGGGSIKKNKIYDSIYQLLSGYYITELAGVEPNPKITSVREGVRICKEKKIDFILAAGGGSTIDCSKAIAAGTYYDGDPWDLVEHPGKIAEALPIVTILTLAATGSEMNGNAVISNKEQNQKLGMYSHNLLPQVSILDPQYLYTLPSIQTAAGCADIMSHLFENYFTMDKDTFVADRFAEGLLMTCIQYGLKAIQEPDNYEARANLMWASSMALNGLTAVGKGTAWTCHAIEHELSAFYDITHGVGLAIITPQWMRYVLSEQTVDKFVAYGENVWKLPAGGDKFETAKAAIEKTEEFFVLCGIPKTLSELGIGMEKFEIMSEKAARLGMLRYAYVPLDKNDVMKILEMCK